VVDQIEFLKDTGPVGKLVFTYLQDIGGLGSQFVSPAGRPAQGPQIHRHGAPLAGRPGQRLARTIAQGACWCTGSRALPFEGMPDSRYVP